jgi:hypothetical protein
MPTTIDERRLRDGAAAKKLSEPVSEAEIRQQLQQLHRAICAMQSLDDLGSDEANQRAWDDMMELEGKYKRLSEKLAEKNAASE